MKQFASLFMFLFCVGLFCFVSGCSNKQKESDIPAAKEPVGVKDLEIKQDAGG